MSNRIQMKRKFRDICKKNKMKREFIRICFMQLKLLNATKYNVES